MPGEQGSEDEVSMSSLHKCTSASQVQNQGLSSTGELERLKQIDLYHSFLRDTNAIY
jgi:hypothetical protein